MHLQETGASDEPDQTQGDHRCIHLSCYIESKIDQDGQSDECCIESPDQTDAGQKHGQAI